jgi:3D-(3,5/4)-trihydroxycyclohexane-1,2-dione acylhydrolase (decyclizing)
MTMIRLTMAQALVRFLAAQRSEIDGHEFLLFAGVFAIFGHGNVAGLGEALYAVCEELPTVRRPVPPQPLTGRGSPGRVRQPSG